MFDSKKKRFAIAGAVAAAAITAAVIPMTMAVAGHTNTLLEADLTGRAERLQLPRTSRRKPQRTSSRISTAPVVVAASRTARAKAGTRAPARVACHGASGTRDRARSSPAERRLNAATRRRCTRSGRGEGKVLGQHARPSGSAPWRRAVVGTVGHEHPPPCRWRRARSSRQWWWRRCRSWRTSPSRRWGIGVHEQLGELDHDRAGTVEAVAVAELVGDGGVDLAGADGRGRPVPSRT